MPFGEKLSQLRKQNHYTQEQLADLLGVSRQSVSKWESDLAFPETEKLIRISERFDCSLDYLLKDAAEGGGQAGETGQSRVTLISRREFREKKSEKTWRGLPLWHVGKRARGVVAVGMHARGVIAIGLRAQGVVSVGLLSLGVVSFGWLSFGLFAFGLLAVGLCSAGCFAVGLLTAGAICLGVLSLGAVAIGDFSVGALAIGRYAALGDHARGMIAIGDTHAAGTLFQTIEELTRQETLTVKELLDAHVPSYLAWAKALFQWFF